MNMKNKFSLASWMTGLFLLFATFLSNAQTVYMVTDSTDGSTPGKLRYAINQANLTSAAIIRFNVPSAGTNPISFVLSSSLPTITKTVILDGTTQPGYATGKIRINIIGVDPATASFPTGIVFSNAPGSKLLAIQVWGFLTGVSIQSSNNCEVINCSINRCTNRTLEISSSSYCIIKGNTINTDRTGTDLHSGVPSLNADKGIYFMNNGTLGSTNNIIGGQACDEGNTIAYVKTEGIDNATSTPALNLGNKFSGNKIYGNTTNDAINLRAAANGNLQAPVITSSATCVLAGTSTVANGIIEIFSGVTGAAIGDKKTAREFLATTIANGSGAWSVSIGISPADRVTATVTDPVTNNTSALSGVVAIPLSTITYPTPVDGPFCMGTSITFTPIVTNMCSPKYVWDFMDGSPLATNAIHIYGIKGIRNFNIYAYSSSGCAFLSKRTWVNIGDPCPPPPCVNCIGSFAPETGQYIISGWVKRETIDPMEVSYSSPRLVVTFPAPSAKYYSFPPSGQIIDGWQRIEGSFTVPLTGAGGITSMMIKLKCLSGTGDCLFDDIRVFPTDGSMKSYVYDPISMKLVAELDERNYSTFYEYDEEGKLIRVKKETEKGIMTIKENRDNTAKR
jgi:parallel beta-helix repeat protein